MNYQNLISIVIVICGCCNLIHTQRIKGSQAIGAGNPKKPSFTLTASQNQQLSPIHPDVYEDSLLSTVEFVSWFYVFSSLPIE